ncbi:hypothetical protein C0J52_24708 [Blattella germanica]|nr:hypothetical protein C0J52_24708 [Blattella germanica]
MASSSTVRTVTTTTTTQQAPNLDNNLDALLEDLQTSVSRPPSAAAMNGTLTPSGSRTYREVTTRTIQNDAGPGYQVQYLSAANPTTVVSERASSPGVGLLNLNELDSLLVDLHHAQKTGFGTEHQEPVEHGTPTRQQLQQVTRVVQQQRTYIDGGGTSPSPVRYQTEPQSSPRLQPKRSSSAQRELTYGTVDTQHRTRSPSPMRHPDPSPRVPHRSVVQKETYYETKGSSTPKQERYRDKSPSNRRLQKEMYYESSKSSTPIPPSPQHDRYRDPSPPAQRRGVSPMRTEPYPGQPVGSSRVTTVRTYNYSTTGVTPPSPVPPTTRSGAVSPSPVSRSPYPDHGTPVLDLPPSPSPGISYSSSPQPVPGGTKVTTTVRTYTYDHPGSGQPYPPGSGPYPPGSGPYPPGSGPYPPGSGSYPPGSGHSYPPGSGHSYPPGSNQPYPPVEPPSERTLTYQVSPREKEPLIEPTPPPTVITYKYSSHSSHSTSSKFPTHPEEQQPLLPRPFPTPSPTPMPNVNSEPPKRLDDLMASFSDTETTTMHNHYPPEKPAHPQPVYPEHANGVAVVTPTPNAKATAAAAASASAAANAKDRPKTKNVAGPPVYYPPGVELFAKKEEAMMQASGKKASGRYEYEYAKESKSKSSSSGGAAVVPVCLPLCCAMPCVIM